MISIPTSEHLKALLESMLKAHQGVMWIVTQTCVVATRNRDILHVTVSDQKVSGQRIDQRAGEDEGPEQGEHHCHGHRSKQKSGDSREEKHRNERDADAQKRH